MIQIIELVRMRVILFYPFVLLLACGEVVIPQAKLQSTSNDLFKLCVIVCTG